MPNWIKSFIKLKGEKDELDKLQTMMIFQYGGVNHSAVQTLFNRLVPMPKTLAEAEVFKWRYEHWGTNCEAQELWYFRSSCTMLELSFETAWATPLEIFKAIQKEFPSITLGGYYADENYGHNCGLIVGNRHCAEILRLGDESDAAVEFSEKVWDMIADEVYVGKKLEAFLKGPVPTVFVEVGLVDEK